MRYRYEALTPQGARNIGQCEAQSLPELERVLARRALVLLSARLSRGSYGQRRLGWQAHAQFCYQLYQMLNAGVPLLDILAEIRDGTTSQSQAQLYGQLHTLLEEGSSFASALAAHPRQFDSLLRQGMQAAEASGRMVEVLTDLHGHYVWREQMHKQGRKALAYPLFAGAVLLGATVFLLVYLMPQVREFVAETGAPLPLATRALLGLVDVLAHYGIALAVSLVMLIGAFCAAWLRVPAWRLLCDQKRLRLPVFGALSLHEQLAQYTRSLGLLYDAGVPVLDALQLAEAGVANQALHAELHQARLRVEQGSSLADGFGLIPNLPPLLLSMLRTGERTGQLGSALQQVSSFCQQQVRATHERLQGMIEPGMTLILGGMLAWVMLAVLSPVFDSLSHLR